MIFGLGRGAYAAGKMMFRFDDAPVPPPNPGRREAIGSISASSRRRLRERIWAVQPALLPRLLSPTAAKKLVYPASFVTLTYPAEDLALHQERPRQSKQHLDRFVLALRRRWPGTWGAWVLEYQRRGSPHFHLLVKWGQGSETWSARRGFVSATWASIIAEDREGDVAGVVAGKSLRAGTRVEPLKAGKDLIAYIAGAGKVRQPLSVAVACELGKRSQKTAEGQGQGRWWGIFNRAAYQASARIIEIELPKPLGYRIWAEIISHWEEVSRRRGFEWPEGRTPTWLDARGFQAALQKADPQRAFWRLDTVDQITGEIFEEDPGEAKTA